MPIDLEIMLDSINVKYDYEIKDKRLFIKFYVGHQKKLNIKYDFNIYDDFKIESGNYPYKEGFLEINLTKNKIFEFKFSLSLNYKYYIKIVYRYNNEAYDKNKLIDDLEFLYKVNQEDEVLNIIKILKEINIEDKFLYYEVNKMILDILTNNDYCKNIVDRMNDYDLLNLITYDIASSNPINISQKKLDELVKEAMKHEYTSENIWRLAMHYDGRGYNFKLIEEYFVNNKDVYYLGEYVSSIYQVNKDNIVNLLIKLNDKEYIKKVLEDNFLKKDLAGKYRKKLEEAL